MGKADGEFEVVTITQLREEEVLNALYWFCTADGSWRRPFKWARPMDLGGSDASHHSPTLARLCKKGLATRKDVRAPWGRRSVYLYRLTEAGLKMWNARRNSIRW